MHLGDPPSPYDDEAQALALLYERLRFEDVHGWLLDLLPERPGLVLDVGAGSGRDAAWFAAAGHEVVAVEPSSGMRAQGRRLHPQPRIRWIDDALPSLNATLRLGLSFDLILLSAVWMHVRPEERRRAFRKLITLLKPGGLLAISLRLGAPEARRAMYPVSLEEVEGLARAHGALVVRSGQAEDRLGRNAIRWAHVALRLPDDGTGALPLLRHVVLNDAKSSTYKLALLRTIARIADGPAGMAQEADDDFVSLPLGLVGLYWLRLFMPLLAADLPQSVSNRGIEGLGFVGPAYRKLAAISHLDLRVGMRFSSEAGAALAASLKHACATITNMPARYMTLPNSDEPVLRTRRHGRFRPDSQVVLDEPFLRGYGELLVPRHLWRALQRFDAWIEPAIIAEWIRLTQFYGERQGRIIDLGRIAKAMEWSEPSRDVRLARELAAGMLEAKQPLHCVWSGRSLQTQNLDIDHCFPWSAWPCDDLWNLLPTHREVNQRQKRQKLVSAETLVRAREPILDWWRAAYVRQTNEAVRTRFFAEASGTLYLPEYSPALPLEDVFDGVLTRRLALRQDQQVEEWKGAT
jgi:SAM-dependent methyltransferase